MDVSARQKKGNAGIYAHEKYKWKGLYIFHQERGQKTKLNILTLIHAPIDHHHLTTLHNIIHSYVEIMLLHA